jgi:hypothetical protein
MVLVWDCMMLVGGLGLQTWHLLERMAIEADQQTIRGADPMSCYCCGEVVLELWEQEVVDASEHACEVSRDPLAYRTVTCSHLWTGQQSCWPLMELVAFAFALEKSSVQNSSAPNLVAKIRHCHK